MGKTVERFPAGQVVKITGITYSVLDYWVKTGFIVPAQQKGKGKGSDRLFSFGDVVAIKAALRLRALGASLQGIRQAIRHIQKQHNLPESGAAGGLERRDIFGLENRSKIVEKSCDGVIAMLEATPTTFAFDWVINLQSVCNEVPKAAQQTWMASAGSAKRKKTA